MNRREFTWAALAPIASSWASGAHAQGWPDKPVKLLLSQPAGSGPDLMARMIGDQLARKWGQPIVVENRPGGQNAIGAQAAATTPAALRTFMEEEVQTWKGLAKSMPELQKAVELR